MANPQLENGHIKIANEIFEALMRIRISGEARQVLDTIIRKTYGFNKKEDAISLSQFCLATGLSKTGVCKGITKLVSLNIITKKGNDVANVYSLVKDFTLWKPLPKKETLPKKEIIVTKKGKKYYPKSDIQKTVTKDTITKDILQSKTTALVVSPKKEKRDPNTPIHDWAKYLNVMDEHPGRHINIIAHYFREKGLYFETYGKAESAIRRHLRAAQQLAPFDDKEISEATRQAKKDYPELWTVDTLTKILSR